jgi:nitrite reductase (NO-forming)
MDGVVSLGQAETVKIHLTAIEKKVDIADGRSLAAWTFEGTIPGPVIRVRQGDSVEFTVENKGTLPHSIDLHAAQTPPDRHYKSIGPGQSLTYTWRANYPGIFNYYCGTAPMIQHIANGMYGAIIVDPPNPRPPAREIVLVQSEIFSSPTDIQGMMNRETKNVVFNGYVNKYVGTPLEAKPGELIRFYVVNAGPNSFSAFHVIGGIFDRVYESGNPANVMRGVQTWTIPPGGAALFEIILPEEGIYPMVTHSMADGLSGALAFLKVSKDAGPPGALMP